MRPPRRGPIIARSTFDNPGHRFVPPRLHVRLDKRSASLKSRTAPNSYNLPCPPPCRPLARTVRFRSAFNSSLIRQPYPAPSRAIRLEASIPTPSTSSSSAPARPDYGRLSAQQGGQDGARPRAGPELRRRHQPHGEHEGFLFDIGGHRFFSKSKEVVDLWNEILPDDFIERPRLSRIYYARQVLRLSAEGVRGAAEPRPGRRALRCMLSYRLCEGVRPIAGPAHASRTGCATSSASGCSTIFFKTYTEKVWGMPCDEISADWAAQRIKGLILGAAVLERARAKLRRDGAAAARSVKTLIESFQLSAPRPRHDVGSRGAQDRASRAARSLMGRESSSAGIRRRHGRVTHRSPAATATTRRIAAARDLVGAAARAGRQHGPAAPRRRAAGRASSRYRDFLTVALIVTRPDLFPDNWIYIHDPR